jgi:hypothetical protein
MAATLADFAPDVELINFAARLPKPMLKREPSISLQPRMNTNKRE